MQRALRSATFKGDGADLSATLTGKTMAGRAQPLFWKRPPDRPGSPEDPWPDFAIREGNLKFLMQADGSNPQLYDVVKDLGETNNLAAAQPQLVQRLTKAALNWNKTLPVVKTRRALAHYYAEVTYLDDQVGRVMQAIERTGQADNTLFVFLSEQGSTFAHGKWTLYDVGIRSATIARWPAKIKPGTTNGALCQYVDFLPTFISMAGGKAIPDLDGRDISDVLTGQNTKGRDYVYAEETSRGIINGPEAYGIRAVADKDWKYILNLNSDATFKNTEINTPRFKSWVKKAETDAFAREQVERYQHRSPVELYDLKNDPYEMKNLADQPAQKANLTRLRAALDAWMKEQGDEGVKTEMEARQHQGSGLVHPE